jgi:LPXTG-motif cell wall-anchored protein
MTAIALIGALAQIAPVYAQGTSFPPPDESALVTAVGCLQLGGKHQDKYVLTDQTAGPATNVPEATCTPTSSAPAFRVKHDKNLGINESMLGKWIEISGRLEKEESDDPDNLREFYARSFRMVPVLPRTQITVIEPRPEATPPPAAQQAAVAPQAPAAEPAPEAPVGTSGEAAAEKKLPRTASELPAITLIGLLSLAGSLGLRRYRRSEHA